MKEQVTLLKHRLSEQNSSIKTLENMMVNRNEKMDLFEQQIITHKDRLTSQVNAFYEIQRKEMQKMDTHVREFDSSLKEMRLKVDSLVENLQRQMVDNITDIFNKVKAEDERYDVVNKKLAEFPKMQNDLKYCISKIKSFEKEQWSAFEESQFVERCIPMITHLQISEALQAVFQGEEQFQKQLLDFENKKVKELHEFYIFNNGKATNLRALKNRVLFMMRNFYKECKGVYSFNFGRDYRPEMPDEEIEYLNQGILFSL